MGGHFQHGHYKTLDGALEAVRHFSEWFTEHYHLHLQTALIEWDDERGEYDVSVYMSK